MQLNHDVHSLTLALGVLSAVIRAARFLWPEEKEKNDRVVKVEVALLKSMPIADVLSSPSKGVAWVLFKENDNEGSVDLMSMSEINRAIDVSIESKGSTRIAMLDLSAVEASSTTPQD